MFPMKHIVILAALLLSACHGDPPGTQPDAMDMMIVSGMMNRPAYTPVHQPPPMLPQTVTYQRTGPGTVMAY